jgi:hypothetical protein
MNKTKTSGKKSPSSKKLPKGTPPDYLTTKKHGIVSMSEFQDVVTKMVKTPPMPKKK